MQKENKKYIKLSVHDQIIKNKKYIKPLKWDQILEVERIYDRISAEEYLGHSLTDKEFEEFESTYFDRNNKSQDELNGVNCPKLKKNILKTLVWDKTNGICYYCKTKLHPFRNYQIDHFIPKSKGGSEDLENLFPSCISCNMHKGNRPVEYLEKKLKENKI